MKTFTDPVCGMMVREGDGLPLTYRGEHYHFCSEFCEGSFQAEPERYLDKLRDEARDGVGMARHIAHFLTEVAVDSRMQNYSRGLGVLAGDTLKSCADLKINSGSHRYTLHGAAVQNKRLRLDQHRIR